MFMNIRNLKFTPKPAAVGNKGANRFARLRHIRTGGNKAVFKGTPDRHVINVVRVPDLRPDGRKCLREFAYHARKGWRSYLVMA